MNEDALPWRELSTLFTAVLCIDDNGGVVYASELIGKHVPGIRDGGSLFEIFEFQRPKVVKNMAALRDHLGALFLMKARDGSFAARGQFVQATWQGTPVLCFCGSPWLFWMTENRPDVKLGMSDFSAQDSQLDQLFLMSAEQRMVADLEKLNADLKLAKQETERAQEARNAFFARMSHEMRTPLNGVVSALSLLSDESLNPDAERLLDLAHGSSRNLLQVINYILDVSKIESEDAAQNVTPFHLPRLLESVTEVVRARAEEKGLELYWRAGDELAEGYLGDKDKLRQSLLNLVTNAIKFTRAGLVVLRALPAGDELPGFLRFEVEDTGPGINIEDQENIFGPFWTSGRVSDGGDESTGLGLDIVRRSVAAMGGTVGVVSEPGSGSLFWIEVPLEVDGSVAEEAESDNVSIRDLPTRFDGDVLLVDDNATNIMLGRMILESLGVRVHEARNGVEAADQALSRDFDLVLMDISMPVMDGVEATRRIREQRSDRELPIVALSAYASSKEEKRCADAGMNDYLTKPIVRERLAEQLNRWLKAADEDPSPASEGVPTKAADKPPLDLDVIQQLREQIGAENVDTVLDQFQGEVQERWQSLLTAFHGGDLGQVIRETHTLASTCASLGLADAGDYFRNLENGMRESHMLLSDLGDARQRLDRGLEALAGFRAGA